MTVAALLALVVAATAARPLMRAVEAIQLANNLLGHDGGLGERLVPDALGRTGDLYSHGDAGARPGLLLVPGADQAGKDHPRLISVARRLADAGFTVLVPEIANLRRLQARAADAAAIGHAAAALGELTRGPIGVIAISYAVGPAILAALETPGEAHIALILAVGGYYDMGAVITFLTTGASLDAEGRVSVREPNPYGKWVFALSNADTLTDPGERTALSAIAIRRMGHADSPIDDLAATLGPEGQAVLALLVNRRPEAVPGLMAALPESVGVELRALDLKTAPLDRLKARLLLVHGRDDPIIPASESVALAAAAPRSELYLFDRLRHVIFEPGAVGDALTLMRVAYHLLEWRDRRFAD